MKTTPHLRNTSRECPLSFKYIPTNNLSYIACQGQNKGSIDNPPRCGCNTFPWCPERYFPDPEGRPIAGAQPS